MPTLYVENIPDDLYEALKGRAKSNGRSLSAELINLLSMHVPTPKELARRRRVFDNARRIRERNPVVTGPFESTEEMLRADRGR